MERTRTLCGGHIYRGRGVTGVRQIALALVLQPIIHQSAFCLPSMVQRAMSYYDGCFVSCRLSAVCTSREI
jgi:hypothetical protein